MENITNVAPTPSNNSNNTRLIAGVVVVAAFLVIVLMVMAQPRTTTAPSVNVQNTTVEVSAQPTNSATPTASSVPGMMAPTPTPQTTPSPTSTTDQQSNVVEVKLDAGSFFYSQKEIRVKKGDTVKITMTSKDMMHDFTIDELNVESGVVKSGESKTFEFVASKTGSFEYYCSVGSHRQNGQVGKLIVE